LIVLLSLVTSVLSHNAVFLLSYGSRFQVALSATGHDSRWADAVTGVLAAACVLALAGSLGLVRLFLIAGRTARSAWGASRGDLQVLQDAVIGLWVRIATLSIVLFVVQENLERGSAGLALPGLGVLWSPDALTLPIFLGISLVAAVVGGLFRWSRAVLLARIAAARAPHSFPRPGSPARVRVTDVPPDGSPIARNLAGRAPPVPTPA